MVELCAPNFVVEEVANALWRAIKLQRISEEDAKIALEALGDMKIELYEINWAQASQELSIACKLNLTVYDASYLLLTNKTKTCLITADEKLCKNARRYFRVMHIKEYP